MVTQYKYTVLVPARYGKPCASGFRHAVTASASRNPERGCYGLARYSLKDRLYLVSRPYTAGGQGNHGLLAGHHPRAFPHPSHLAAPPFPCREADPSFSAAGGPHSTIYSFEKSSSSSLCVQLQLLLLHQPTNPPTPIFTSTHIFTHALFGPPLFLFEWFLGYIHYDYLHPFIFFFSIIQGPSYISRHHPSRSHRSTVP